MKLFIKLNVLLLLVSFNLKAQNSKYNFIGKWEVTDHWNNKSDFILDSNNYVSMSINGQFVDGKNFVVHGGKNDGQKGELKYSIDYDKDPIEIDIIAIKNGEEKGRILGVIKITNENEFLMTFSYNGKRDFDFSTNNSKNFAILKRKN